MAIPGKRPARLDSCRLPLRRFSDNRRRSGQVVSEYGLFIGIVAVVGIGSLVLLGGNLTNALGWLNNGFEGQMNASNRIQARPADPTPDNNPLDASDTGITASAGNMVFRTANGAPITLNYQNVKDAIATAGSNGTTEMLANNLASIARQLKDNGSLTPEQANYLLQMANHGHEMARIEKFAEETVRQRAERGIPQDAPVEYEGRQYDNLWELTKPLGYGALVRGTYEHGASSQKMLDLLQQAEASGALQDTQVRATVTALTEDIINIGNGVEDSVISIAIYGHAPAQMEQIIMAGLNERFENGVTLRTPDAGVPASAMTHEHSGTICRTGQGQDSGTHCR